MMKRRYKLAKLLGLLFIVSTLIIVLPIMYYSYKTIVESADNKLKESFIQNAKFFQTLVEQKELLILNNLQRIHLHPENIDKDYHKELTKEVSSVQLDSQIDLLILKHLDHYHNFSESLIDTDSIAKYIIDKNTNFSKNPINIEIDNKKYVLLLRFLPIIDNQTGKVIAKLYGGIILNDNLSLINLIASKTNTENLLITADKAVIVSTTKYKDEIINSIYDLKPNEIYKNQNIIISKNIISKDSKINLISILK